MSWGSDTGLGYVSQGRAQIYGYCVLRWRMRRLNMELDNLPQMTIYQELEVFLTDATRSADARGGRRLSLNRYVALRHDCQKLELLLNCQVSVGK